MRTGFGEWSVLDWTDRPGPVFKTMRPSIFTSRMTTLLIILGSYPRTAINSFTNVYRAGVDDDFCVWTVDFTSSKIYCEKCWTGLLCSLAKRASARINWDGRHEVHWEIVINYLSTLQLKKIKLIILLSFFLYYLCLTSYQPTNLPDNILYRLKPFNLTPNITLESFKL